MKTLQTGPFGSSGNNFSTVKNNETTKEVFPSTTLPSTSTSASSEKSAATPNVANSFVGDMNAPSSYSSGDSFPSSSASGGYPAYPSWSSAETLQYNSDWNQGQRQQQNYYSQAPYGYPQAPYYGYVGYNQQYYQNQNVMSQPSVGSPSFESLSSPSMASSIDSSSESHALEPQQQQNSQGQERFNSEYFSFDFKDITLVESGDYSDYSQNSGQNNGVGNGHQNFNGNYQPAMWNIGNISNPVKVYAGSAPQQIGFKEAKEERPLKEAQGSKMECPSTAIQLAIMPPPTSATQTNNARDGRSSPIPIKSPGDLLDELFTRKLRESPKRPLMEARPSIRKRRMTDYHQEVKKGQKKSCVDAASAEKLTKERDALNSMLSVVTQRNVELKSKYTRLRAQAAAMDLNDVVVELELSEQFLNIGML